MHIITCLLNGAVEASTHVQLQLWRTLPKGMMLKLNFEEQINVKEMKSGGVGGSLVGKENGTYKKHI